MVGVTLISTDKNKNATLQMQTEENIQVADQATEQNGNLNEADLLSFLSSESQIEDQAPEPTEKSEESEESESTNVLSQLEEEVEETEEESDETEESQESEETEVEEAEEAETTEVDQDAPKSVQKLLKQIGRLTARSKSAEEAVEALTAQVESLKLEKKVESNPSIEEINSFDELEVLRKEALSAKKWARSHEDEQYVQDGDKEYTREEIKRIRDSAEEHLEELIPERMKFLQQKQSAEALMSKDFTFMKNQASPEMKIFQGLMQDENLKVLDKLPNSAYLKALIAEGVAVVKNRRTPKKAIKSRIKTAPPKSLPDDVSPPVQKKDNTSDIRKKFLGEGNISQDQLTAFLINS